MASTSIVDLGLVLAVDVSSSIDNGDYGLQMLGTAKALRQPDIFEAITSGPSQAIALSLVQWSTPEKQAVSVPWRVIASRSDLEGAATAIENTHREWRPGGTGMAVAIRFCAALMAQLPVQARRRVIDVSGDGADNENGDVPAARNAAVAQGIIINGLPVITSSTVIAGYYAKVVIGGDGSFTEPAETVADFGEAMHRKLLREILSPVT